MMEDLGLMFQIAKFRRARGLTQEELADKIGSTQANISEVERGIHMPSIETLRKIAEVFDMEIVDLFEKSTFRRLNPRSFRSFPDLMQTRRRRSSRSPGFFLRSRSGCFFQRDVKFKQVFVLKMLDDFNELFDQILFGSHDQHVYSVSMRCNLI
jgi:transcriptional regulator with XRE-family HTH domain